MRRFRFPLETLLEVRKREEEAVKLELAARNGQILAAQQNFMELQAALKELQESQKAGRSSAGDIVALRHSVTYRHKLKTDMLRKGREIQSLQVEAEKIRQKLVAATQRRRAIELIRERRLEEWRHQYNVQEQKLTDDVSQQKYIRDRKAAARRAASY